MTLWIIRQRLYTPGVAVGTRRQFIKTELAVSGLYIMICDEHMLRRHEVRTIRNYRFFPNAVGFIITFHDSVKRRRLITLERSSYDRNN